MDKMKKMNVWKPKDVKEIFEDEKPMHKMKIACNAAAMFLFASFWQTYFSNVQNRSGHYQMRMLAGELSAPKYIDRNSEDYAEWRLKQDFLGQTNLKDLKYITSGWDMYSVDIGESAFFQGPQQNTTDDQFYYTQGYVPTEVRAESEAQAKKYAEDRLGYNNDAYDKWVDFYDGIIWFDTYPCTKGPHIGEINSIEVSST